MHKKLYSLLIAALTLLFIQQGISQTKIDTLTEPAVKKELSGKKIPFKIGVDYTSNSVFMGRAGKNKISVLALEGKYTFNSGLYISASGDFLPNKATKKIDGGDLSAGYDFNITDNFSGGVSYTKLFYNATSTQIGSSASNTFSANLSYDLGTIITPAVSADYSINKQGIPNDIFVNFGLSHDFIIEKIFGSKDFLLISPTVSLNMGTQNFYDAYLTKKVLKNTKLTAAQNALIDRYQATVSNFKLLDYEFSVPIEYKIGNFIIQAIPTYAVVENQFKSAAISKSLGISPKSSIFYFTAGASIKF